MGKKEENFAANFEFRDEDAVVFLWRFPLYVPYDGHFVVISPSLRGFPGTKEQKVGLRSKEDNKPVQGVCEGNILEHPAEPGSVIYPWRSTEPMGTADNLG